MKLSARLLTATLLVAFTFPTPAQDAFAPGFFTGIYATARADQLDSFDQIADNHEAGGGLEFGYAFSRRFSVALELHGTARAIPHDFLNEAGLTASWGIPLGNIKPYALAGVGYEILNQKLELNSYAGGGVEAVVYRKLRAFVDARTYLSGHDDTVLARVGLRQGF